MVAGGAGLLLLAIEAATRVAGLSGARRRFTGSLAVAGAPGAPVPVADPARLPVTQWLDDRVQVLDPSAWRLRVTAGGSAREWAYEELTAFGDQVEAVLDCTGGWYATATWEGVRLDRLLPPGAAGSVVVTSATGYRRRLPAGDAGTLLLATRLAGRPLSAGHGFGPPGRPRPPRLLVGQVGGLGRARPGRLVAPAAVPPQLIVATTPAALSRSTMVTLPPGP